MTTCPQFYDKSALVVVYDVLKDVYFFIEFFDVVANVPEGVRYAANPFAFINSLIRAFSLT